METCARAPTLYLGNQLTHFGADSLTPTNTAPQGKLKHSNYKAHSQPQADWPRRATRNVYNLAIDPSDSVVDVSNVFIDLCVYVFFAY